MISASALAITAGSMLICGPAYSQSRFTTDVSVAGGIATNPLQSVDDTGTSGTVTVDIVPQLTVDDALTTYNIRGFARFVEYTRDIRSNNSFGLNGLVENRISEVTQLRANISYLTSIVGANDAFFAPIAPVAGSGVIEQNPVIPDPLVPDLADDIGLNGFNQRRHNVQSGIGISSKFSPLDSVSANVSASAIRYDGSSFQDEYNYYTQNLSYSRRVSELGDIGASVTLGETNYLRQQIGDAFTVTPTITWSKRLSPTLNISTGAGIAYTRVQTGFGNRTSTDFSGSLNLCRTLEYSSLCFGASRRTLPSSFGGVRSQSSLDLSYSQRLSRRDSINASVSYSRSSNPILDNNAFNPILDNNTQSLSYLRGFARYNRAFTDRLSGFVSAGYADTYQPDINRKANFQGNVGINYRFGKIR